MAVTAHPSNRFALTRLVVAPVCIAGTVVAVATVAVVSAGREAGAVGFLVELELAPWLLLAAAGLVLSASLVPWLLLSDRPAAAAALAVGASASQVPVWAGWDGLTPLVRALVLSPTPIVAAAVAAAIAGSRRLPVTAGTAAVLATALHAAAYDPFRDLDCGVLRTCAEAPRLLGGRPAELALLGSAGLGVVAAAAALLAVVGVRRATPVLVTSIVAVLLAGAILLTGRVPLTFAGQDLPTDVLLVVATSAVALAVGEEHLRLLRTRGAVDRLIHQLETSHEPGSLPSHTTLTPAQQLALDNALLMARSRAALAETASIQRRTQQRADDERERIERDLHDGAQQQLVSAAMQLGLAASTGPKSAASTLEESRRRVVGALQALRDIGHGSFPRVLVDEGLVPALEDICAEHGVDLEVDPSFTECGDAQVRRAVYAVVAALVSDAPNECVVRVRRAAGPAAVAVSADGFRPPLPQPVLDRVRSVSGEIISDSAFIKVVIPCAW